MSEKSGISMIKGLEFAKGAMVEAFNAFLRDLLRKGKAAAVLAPQRVPSGEMLFPALVSNPEILHADPFAPVLPVATAKMVSTLTCEGTLPSRVAVVMTNCQIRALIELVKLKQADTANVLIIGMDCVGTFAITDYTQLTEEKNSEELFLSLLREEQSLVEKARPACRTCREPIPEHCDILVGLYGMEEGILWIETRSERGVEALEGLDLKDIKDSGSRKTAIENLKGKRLGADKKFREEHGHIKGIEEVAKFYARCINCQNCRRVCPICYCEECFFCSDNLSQTAESLLSRARARGAFKMPLDTLLFHTGRMNHMILSCVECGLCEQACPVNIPLMRALKRAASDAQAAFDYTPGRRPDEEMPLKVFREDEFSHTGEE
jgi:formate dehydrogenase subunit beta